MPSVYQGHTEVAVCLSLDALIYSDYFSDYFDSSQLKLCVTLKVSVRMAHSDLSCIDFIFKKFYSKQS